MKKDEGSRASQKSFNSKTVVDRFQIKKEKELFEVLAKAQKLEKQGREIIHLEIGEPDFDTPINVKKAIQAIQDGSTHYVPSAGS